MSRAPALYSRYFAICLLFIMAELLLIFFADRPIAIYFTELANSPITSYARAVTDYAKSVWYLWPSGLIVIFCFTMLRLAPVYRRDLLIDYGYRFLLLFLSVATSGIFTDIVKILVGRTRPKLWVHEGIYTLHPGCFGYDCNSFPSGHATTAFILIFCLSWLFPRQKPIWILYGLLLAATRIIVGAHYLSDVLAGGFIAFITVETLRWLNSHNRINHIKNSLFPIDCPPDSH